METSTVSSGVEGEFLGHPKGLYILFFTEMWERFSYYGMRALLLLYMINYFKWTQEQASGTYKWYVSLVYLTPLLGGYLADRYLGNKRAIIIGASLMAIGHFCMAFEQEAVFYSALVFLIIGNGFFKPNMSVQVGRLYPANDPRRDSAYTIFYMGINLGAFASPIACGWLRQHTKWGYHAGFAAAGVGMVLGLIVYLLGQRWIKELPPDVQYEEPDDEDHEKATPGSENLHYMSEEEAAKTPSVIPFISDMASPLFGFFAVASVVGSALLWYLGVLKWDNAFAFGLGGGVSAIMGAAILSKVTMALRDRVIVIFLVGVFVVFFWSAFEQAGSAMNVFADKTTNRYLTEEAPPPPIYPAVAGEEAASGGNLLNPVSTESFQSINALAIFILAPIFAWMWIFLPRHGVNLSIPAKVAIGVFMQAVAFALMIWAIQYENQPSSARLEAMPSGVHLDAKGRLVFRDAPDLTDTEAFDSFASAEVINNASTVVHGGRISFDSSKHQLNMHGVLSDTDRDRILRATVSKDYLLAVKELAEESEVAETDSDKPFAVSVTLPNNPPGLDLRYAGLGEKKLTYDPATRQLTTTEKLVDKDYKAILIAGADPAFRNALNEVYVASAKFKVTPMWLVVFYVLCTLGELCLSPVGLSMVSKLAPAKFATMLMGAWLMTSFFGNFMAGLAGESYGAIHPTEYFFTVAKYVGIASLVCFLLVKKMRAMMHGVT